MGEQGKWQLAEKFFRELEAEQLDLMAKEAAASGGRQHGGAGPTPSAAAVEPATAASPAPVAAFPGMTQHLDQSDAPGANPEAIAAAAAAVAALAAHQQALVAASGGAAVPLDFALLQQLAAQMALPAVSTAAADEDTEAGESFIDVASAAAEAVLATPRGGSPDQQLQLPADMQQQQQQHGASFFSYFSGASVFKPAASFDDGLQPVGQQLSSSGSPSSVADAAAALARRSPFAREQQAPAGPLGAAWTSDNAASRGLSLHLTELTAPAASKASTAAPGAPAAQPKLKPLPKGRGPVNEVVCGALMLAYERAGKWQEAVGMLERARTLGKPPFLATPSSLLPREGPCAWTIAACPAPPPAALTRPLTRRLPLLPVPQALPPTPSCTTRPSRLWARPARWMLPSSSSSRCLPPMLCPTRR